MSDDNRFSIRLDPPDRERIDRLTNHYGFSDRSNLIRHLLRRECRTLKLDSDIVNPPSRRGRPKKNLSNSKKSS